MVAGISAISNYEKVLCTFPLGLDCQIQSISGGFANPPRAGVCSEILFIIIYFFEDTFENEEKW